MAFHRRKNPFKVVSCLQLDDQKCKMNMKRSVVLVCNSSK